MKHKWQPREAMLPVWVLIYILFRASQLINLQFSQ